MEQTGNGAERPMQSRVLSGPRGALCLGMAFTCTMCMLVLTIVMTRAAWRMDGQVHKMGAMSDEGFRALQVGAPLMAVMHNRSSEVDDMVVRAHAMFEFVHNISQDPRVQAVDWPGAVVASTDIERHASTIVAHLDVLFGVVDDPRVKARDWAGLVSNATQIIQWFETGDIFRHTDAWLQDLDAFVSRMNAMADAFGNANANGGSRRLVAHPELSIDKT